MRRLDQVAHGLDRVCSQPVVAGDFAVITQRRGTSSAPAGFKPDAPATCLCATKHAIGIAKRQFASRLRYGVQFDLESFERLLDRPNSCDSLPPLDEAEPDEVVPLQGRAVGKTQSERIRGDIGDCKARVAQQCGYRTAARGRRRAQSLLRHHDPTIWIACQSSRLWCGAADAIKAASLIVGAPVFRPV